MDGVEKAIPGPGRQLGDSRKKSLDGWAGQRTNFPIANASAVAVQRTSDREGLPPGPSTLGGGRPNKSLKKIQWG